MKSSMECVVLTVIVEAEPTIDVADVMRLDGVLGDDAKLAATSPHCSRQVRAGGRVNIDDGSVSHNSFPANDAVSGKTFLRTEEGYAALEKVSTNTYESCMTVSLWRLAYQV